MRRRPFQQDEVFFIPGEVVLDDPEKIMVRVVVSNPRDTILYHYEGHLKGIDCFYRTKCIQRIPLSKEERVLFLLTR